MLSRYPTDSFAVLLGLRITFLLLNPTPVQAQAVYPSTSPSTSQSPSIDCSNVRTEINILTDQSPQETNWILSKITTTDDITILEGNPQEKGSYYTDEICLEDGEYNFTIYDSYGDGICCIGGDGYYSISLDGIVIAKGGDFGTNETVSFSIPYDKFPSQSPSMSLTPTIVPSLSVVPSASLRPSFTSFPSVSTSPSMSSLPSEVPSSLPTVCII